MKRSLIFLISSATALVFGACNQHSWEEGTEGNPPTKKIFEEHGHGDHADEAHEGGHEKSEGGAHEKEVHPATDEHKKEPADHK